MYLYIQDAWRENILDYDCTMFLKGNQSELINFADWLGVVAWM
jgi:hypothetical protein